MRALRAGAGDHPRSRGVYWRGGGRRSGGRGSSPLARGLRPPRATPTPCTRIIPARAGFTCCPPGGGSPIRDHPRSRGVYGPAPWAGSGPPGSSPLARGLPGYAGDLRADLGIIPARAGFTGPAPVGGCREPDHPRSRGVYQDLAQGVPIAQGSSPLARGLPPRRRASSSRSRIIPARAGFTPWSLTPTPPRRDHPRSRGVYRAVADGTAGDWGSSPLARGLPGSAPVVSQPTRIIPARAGFTPPPTRRPRPGRDHPRSRGVYRSKPRPNLLARGSSPLARGLRGEPDRHVGLIGIIPARAGFTPAARALVRGPQDHPRSRGVYASSPATRRDGTGSSPLARGLRSLAPGAGDSAGIIPARAGFTGGACGRGMGARDHPRSRGVYPPGLPRSGQYHGSSPLARGLPPLRPVIGVGVGIIPARAGFTMGAWRSRPRTPDHPRSRGVY